MLAGDVAQGQPKDLFGCSWGSEAHSVFSFFLTSPQLVFPYSYLKLGEALLSYHLGSKGDERCPHPFVPPFTLGCWVSPQDCTHSSPFFSFFFFNWECVSCEVEEHLEGMFSCCVLCNYLNCLFFKEVIDWLEEGKANRKYSRFFLPSCASKITNEVCVRTGIGACIYQVQHCTPRVKTQNEGVVVLIPTLPAQDWHLSPLFISLHH